MGIAFRQGRGASDSGQVVLPAAPLPGSLILVQLWAASTTPTGFTDVFGAVIETTAAPSALHQFRSWWGVAQVGDDATYIVSPFAASDYTIAEFTGSGGSSTVWNKITSDYATQQGAGASDHPHKTLSPVVHTGEILVVGALIHNNTTATEFVPDAGYTRTTVQWFGPTMGMVHRIETNTGSYDPGVSTAPFLGGYGAGAVAFSETILPEAGVW